MQWVGLQLPVIAKVARSPQVHKHANLCHFQTLINRELSTPAGQL